LKKLIVSCFVSVFFVFSFASSYVFAHKTIKAVRGTFERLNDIMNRDLCETFKEFTDNLQKNDIAHIKINNDVLNFPLIPYLSSNFIYEGGLAIPIRSESITEISISVHLMVKENGVYQSYIKTLPILMFDGYKDDQGNTKSSHRLHLKFEKYRGTEYITMDFIRDQIFNDLETSDIIQMNLSVSFFPYDAYKSCGNGKYMKIIHERILRKVFRK